MEREVREMQEKVGCESSSVWRREDDVIYPYIFMGPNAHKLEDLELKVGQGLCGTCIADSVEIISNDLTKDERWCSHVDQHTSYRTQNIICLPIIVYDECIGCVQLLNKPGGFTDEDVAVCREMVAFLVENL